MTIDAPCALPGYTAQAYPAAALRVVAGASLGDTLADDTAVPGDVYRLSWQGAPVQLALAGPSVAGGGQFLADAMGRPAEPIRALHLLTFLSSEAERADVLVIEGTRISRMAVPLAPLAPLSDHTLIGIGPVPAGLRIADIVCAAFAPGTRIALPDGSLCPIAALSPGDMVLTRDNGPQPVRWIGRVTLGARGSLAPVVITAGTLGNIGDLVVSPSHRIHVYQRGTSRIGGSACLLVPARHLVEGDRIYRRETAHADYLSLVFDRHEIIYAEGVPVESLVIDPAGLPVLPAPLCEEIGRRFPGFEQARHTAPEPPAESLTELRRRILGGL